MTTPPLPPCSFLTSEDTTQAEGEHEVRSSQESRDTDTANWETPEFRERKMEGKLRWSLDGQVTKEAQGAKSDCVAKIVSPP